MLRTVFSAAAPRVTTASRWQASVARRSTLTTLTLSEHGRSSAMDCCAASAATAGWSIPARKCSWRDMSSASAKAVASGNGDSEAMQGSAGGGGEGQSEEAGRGQDARDPVTGEGIWMDEEDEPLVLEKPKKTQRFCGKVVSDNMDKTIKVAVPYYYYVKGLGRKVIRYSNLMAHDEENSANIGDTVILVDCRRKSKRKKHKLDSIVRKLPRLDT